MHREEKNKIKNVVSMIGLCVTILVIILIGFCIVSGNMESSNTSAQNTNIESTGKPAVETTNNLIPNSNFEMLSKDQSVFTYYRDKATDVVFVCYDEYDSGGLIEMHDPNTGLPLTYEKYLEYQNEK